MYIGHDIQNQFPLSKLKPLKKSIYSIIPLLFLAGVLSYEFGIMLDGPGNMLAISFLITCFIGSFLLVFISYYVYEVWYYKTYQYDLTDDYVIIKKGPLAPQEITIPYDRIQDVYLDQDILDRMFGLYDVHISTATAVSGMRAHIDGVDRKSALGLRELILKKMKEHKRHH